MTVARAIEIMKPLYDDVRDVFGKEDEGVIALGLAIETMQKWLTLTTARTPDPVEKCCDCPPGLRWEGHYGEGACQCSCHDEARKP